MDNIKDQYDVIDLILTKLDFTTKEEVITYCETMNEVVNKKDGGYSENTKLAFAGALETLKNCSLQELINIKKYL